jgi:hypothetical protein
MGVGGQLVVRASLTPMLAACTADPVDRSIITPARGLSKADTGNRAGRDHFMTICLPQQKDLRRAFDLLGATDECLLMDEA